MPGSKSVEDYIEEKSHWRDELIALRKILQETEMEESVKWGMPTYGFGKQNLIGMGGFKHHFCLWFHEGVLLSDKARVLRNAQEGKTKAMRQWRMESAEDIKPDILREMLAETVAHHKAGRKA